MLLHQKRLPFCEKYNQTVISVRALMKSRPKLLDRAQACWLTALELAEIILQRIDFEQIARNMTRDSVERATELGRGNMQDRERFSLSLSLSLSLYLSIYLSL